jgi:hypothetical protein
MDYYKLDNSDMDEKFLKGDPVNCSAVIREEDFLVGKLHKGSPIVIMLSNGKKYMGQVEKFTYQTFKGCASGQLVVLRKF